MVLVGLAFLATCLIGVWSINRLQLNRADLLTRNVRSLQAAQEMEVRLRQLSSHSLLYIMDPTQTRWTTVKTAHATLHPPRKPRHRLFQCRPM